MSNPLRKHIFIPLEVYDKIKAKGKSRQPFGGILEDMVKDLDTQGNTIAHLVELKEKLEQDNKRLTAILKRVGDFDDDESLKRLINGENEN